MSGSRYIDPEILAHLPNLELVARRLVEGVFVGMHKNPHFGFSVEFADHREYVHGDDLRTVDWKVWARKNKYYVKRYEMESHLKAMILLDTSRSMAFGDGKLTKLEYGCYLAASLAYLVQRQNDLAGLVTFDTQMRTYAPPRGSRSHLRLLLHTLETIEPGPSTDIGRVLDDLAQTLKVRGMVILISDLYDEPQAVIDALVHLHHRKHDVIVLHVLDNAELDLPYAEIANFRDLESGARLAVDPAVVREDYQGRVSDFCRQLSQGCQMTNIDYTLVRTSEPIERVLSRYIAFRARRSR